MLRCLLSLVSWARTRLVHTWSDSTSRLQSRSIDCSEWRSWEKETLGWKVEIYFRKSSTQIKIRRQVEFELRETVLQTRLSALDLCSILLRSIFTSQAVRGVRARSARILIISQHNECHAIIPSHHYTLDLPQYSLYHSLISSNIYEIINSRFALEHRYCEPTTARRFLEAGEMFHVSFDLKIWNSFQVRSSNVSTQQIVSNEQHLRYDGFIVFSIPTMSGSCMPQI